MRRPNNHPDKMTEHGNRSDDPLDIILGNSPAILQVKSLIRQVAASDITVLVTGESGTGKELVARSIHELSPRRKEPLVTLNCGAIPEGIFESEIFGHEKGSFTSADHRRQGYFEMADRGTLFLDEIGEMPLQVQVKMLRVLETGRFLRVGGTKEIQVNERVIAATNKELGVEVANGRFRQDLYYRLKAVSIAVPSLRERPGDVRILAIHFASEFAERNGRPKPVFEPEALARLERHHWAGNVRELKNFVESLVALNQEPLITGDAVSSQLGYVMGSENLPMVITRPPEELDRELIYRTLLELRQELNSIKGLLQQMTQGGPHEVDYSFSSAEEIDAYTLDDLEREQIRRALADFNGNRRQAARALGIGERTLYRKIRQYGLK